MNPFETGDNVWERAVDGAWDNAWLGVRDRAGRSVKDAVWLGACASLSDIKLSLTLQLKLEFNSDGKED